MSAAPVRNPLHRLVDLLISYERALSRVHHADTNEARLQALDGWRACHRLVWEGHTARDDALRALADPAKTWLFKVNSRYVRLEDFDLVEQAAFDATGFAVSPGPMGMPEIYSEMGTSREEQWRDWGRQGEGLSVLTRLISRLRELSTRAGETWAPLFAAEGSEEPGRPGPPEGVKGRTMSDDPISKLKEQAAQETRRREAEAQRQVLLRPVGREYDNLRYYGERAGDGGSTRGLAEQIARFLAAVRAACPGDPLDLDALAPDGDPAAWGVALEVYRLCDRGDLDAATAMLDEASALGQSRARTNVTDALQRKIPGAILAPPGGEGPGREQLLLPLWVAFKTAPEALHRYAEWPAIQHFACKLFGHPTFGPATMERLRGWLTAEHGIPVTLGTERGRVVVLLRQAVEERRRSDQGGAVQLEGGSGEEPRWLTVTEAATASGCNPGQISRAADSGTLKSNGKRGRGRLIDAADLSLWLLRRAERGEVTESTEAVERKLKRARGE
jgi:hypothetical protein